MMVYMKQFDIEMQLFMKISPVCYTNSPIEIVSSILKCAKYITAPKYILDVMKCAEVIPIKIYEHVLNNELLSYFRSLFTENNLLGTFRKDNNC